MRKLGSVDERPGPVEVLLRVALRLPYTYVASPPSFPVPEEIPILRRTRSFYTDGAW